MNTQELAKSFNMTEKELIEYVSSIGRVLCENYIKDVMSGKMNLKDAITESVKLWNDKFTSMSVQMLSLSNDYRYRKNIDKAADILVDEIYSKLKAA